MYVLLNVQSLALSYYCTIGNAIREQLQGLLIPLQNQIWFFKDKYEYLVGTAALICAFKTRYQSTSNV